jgi:iron complex outermembrane receptor protein
MTTLAGVSALAMALPAVAQEQEAQEDTDLPGEIIVTAQKREQNLQDVPVAISVVGGDQIANSGAYNIEGIQSLIPTLNFRKGGTTLNSALFLRGVGTINFSIAAEPSVAVVLDGVVLARAGEGFGDLNDIERIEVLRGPQGTLFGKNTSAGVVSIVSKRPTNDFEGSIEASYYEGNEYKVKGTLNVPFNENVRSRWTAFWGQYDGNIRNLTTGNDINGYDRWGVRGIIEADVSDRLSLLLIGDYREADDDCCGEVIGTAPGGAAAGSLDGVDFKGDGTREVRHNLVTATEEKSWGLSLEANLEVGDHTVTSITAYREWDNREIREGDWLDTVFVGVAQLHDDGPQNSNTFSQELRLTSPTGNLFDYVIGAYYYKAEAERTFRRDVITCSATTLPTLPNGLRPCAVGSSTLTFPTSTATFGSDFENYAIFGQATANLTDDFRFIFGGRWTSDHLDVFHDRIPSPVPGPGVRTDTTGFRDETDNNELTWKAGVQYDVNDDLMAYATYSQGYKGPAFNVFFNQTAAQRNPISAETADAYEAGFKSTLADGAVVLNAALFYAKYNDYQANNFDVLNGVVITRLTNAGNVSTKGFEIDFLAQPIDGLRLGGGIAYTDAQIEEFRDATGAISDARKGERLALAPEWKASLGADYTWETDWGVDITFGNQFSYTSSQFSDLGANPLLRIGSYFIWDAALAVEDQNDRWSVRFQVKNVTDESYASLITPGGPGGSLRYLIPREADRYVGITAKLNFGGGR